MASVSTKDIRQKKAQHILSLGKPSRVDMISDVLHIDIGRAVSSYERIYRGDLEILP